MSLQSRLQKLDRALDPTQLVVRWLVKARGCGSLDTWMEGQREVGAREPVTALATEAALAVRNAMKGRPSHLVEEAIAEAVDAVLLRMFMVVALHDHLETEQRMDTLELELLTVTLTSLEYGGPPELDATAWGERCRRLLHETVAWQTTSRLLAQRYFAGHPPVFSDQMAALDATATACIALLERARTDLAPRTGVAVPPVDVARVRQLAEAEAEVAATGITERAAENVDVFTGTKAGVFRLRGLGGRPWAA
jgi:hypothetical protein